MAQAATLNDQASWLAAVTAQSNLPDPHAVDLSAPFTPAYACAPEGFLTAVGQSDCRYTSSYDGVSFAGYRHPGSGVVRVENGAVTVSAGEEVRLAVSLPAATYAFATIITQPIYNEVHPEFGYVPVASGCSRWSQTCFYGLVSEQPFTSVTFTMFESSGAYRTFTLRDIQIVSTPEPSTWVLTATGLLSLGGVAARRRCRTAT